MPKNQILKNIKRKPFFIFFLIGFFFCLIGRIPTFSGSKMIMPLMHIGGVMFLLGIAVMVFQKNNNH
ncbi:MAG: hypothetical protein PHT40_03825 [Patescibacteria group bacterium]|nr:hypothetical protein [Patescibacteria group bacterium]